MMHFGPGGTFGSPRQQSSMTNEEFVKSHFPNAVCVPARGKWKVFKNSNRLQKDLLGFGTYSHKAWESAKLAAESQFDTMYP